MTTTLGPKVIRDESLMEYIQDSRAAAQPRTGIRRSNSGAWVAVRDGRMIDSFAGPGSKASAIRAAGSNAVIA